MGRAGKAAKEEAERLRAQVEQLKQVAVGNSPDASEVEKLRAQVADSELKAKAADARATAQEKALLQSRLAAQIDSVDANAVSKLLADNLVNRDGKWIVIDDNGTDRIDAAGNPVTPEALYREFAESHPWAIRGRTITGTGQGGSSSSAVPTGIPLEKLFGRTSDSRLANNLALRDKRAYDAAKREAISRGLI